MRDDPQGWSHTHQEAQETGGRLPSSSETKGQMDRSYPGRPGSPVSPGASVVDGEAAQKLRGSGIQETVPGRSGTFQMLRQDPKNLWGPAPGAEDLDMPTGGGKTAGGLPPKSAGWEQFGMGAGTPGGLAPGGPPSDVAARDGIDPARPRSKLDLLAAAVSGYGSSFKAAGLRVGLGADGQPAILRSGGGLADDRDLAALAARIRSEPEALTRFPRFFEVLPRERFSDLKVDFKSQRRGKKEAFKHLWLTEEDRDFVRSESCSGISGSCNPYTRLPYYARGDFVPPEDLNRIWSAVHESGSGTPGGGAKAAEARRKLSGSIFGAGGLQGVRDAIGGLFGRIQDIFGDGAAIAPVGEPMGGVPASDGTQPASRPVVRPARSGVALVGESAAGAPALAGGISIPQRRRSGWLYVLIGVVGCGAGLVVFGLKRGAAEDAS